MKPQGVRLPLLLLIGLLAAAMIAAEPASEPAGSACMNILTEAGNRAGLQGIHRNSTDESYSDGTHSCMLEWVVTGTGDQGSAILGLSESQPTPESSCVYEPLAQFELTTFHGYSARMHTRTEPTHMVDGVPYSFQEKSLDWCMHRGGRNYYLMVHTTTQSIERFGPAPDPAAIADVFLAVVD